MNWEILLPYTKKKKNFLVKVVSHMSDKHQYSSSESSTEEVFEEEEFDSLDALEMGQAQKMEEDTQVQSDIESHPPDRPRSPIMWEHPPTLQQQILQSHTQNLASPSENQILDHIVFGGPLQSHRVPPKLLNVFSDRWVGTHNAADFIQVTERLQSACENVKVDYMDVFREVAPTTGHIHYHSIVIFKGKKSAHSVFALDPHGRWEPMRGQLITAWNYAAKGGERAFIFGNPPPSLANHFRIRDLQRQKRSGPTPSQEKFNNMVIRAKNGDESIRDELIYANHMRYFDQVLIAAFIPVIYQGELSHKNIWIYGPPGTGKSRMVHEYCRDNAIRIYVKLQNKWWDGFSGHKLVIIEDADPDVMKHLASHMKIWADRYPFNAEFKGTARMINPDFHLVVTSNYSIEECFNERDAIAIRRRFDVYQME